MYELTVETDFAAAHRLVGYEGLCENLHGHNWKVDVTVKSPTLNDLGMVIDFKDLKAMVGEIMEGFDHKYLNDIAPFDEINPTTENLSRVIAEVLQSKLPEPVRVHSIRVWESPRASATYLADGPQGVVK
ncbi:MAG: 6-carboxytetrahydropterin synthase QueD [Planctomycetota bacterium]|jgi:6-pyruvoyltetrahydropterin/6-carboxytetrahydropterin synthase